MKSNVGCFLFSNFVENVQARLFDSRCEKKKKKSGKFPPVSASTAVLGRCRNPPRHVTFQVASKVNAVAPIFCERLALCRSSSCSSLHTLEPFAPPSDQRLQTYVHIVWSPVCRAPSLTQTAALLQSSVVQFVVTPKKVFRQLLRYSFYFLSFTKGNRSLFLFFSFSPFWTGTSNSPFPLHSWCWMSKGGSQRSRNILLEWYVESSSPPLPFFLSPVMDFKDAATIPCLKGNS